MEATRNSGSGSPRFVLNPGVDNSMRVFSGHELSHSLFLSLLLAMPTRTRLESVPNSFCHSNNQV